MKAWLVYEKNETLSTVVFAETAGKARALAQHTDACEDVEFCDIRAQRIPQIDKYYTDGKLEMDWLKTEDRIALVKEAGFRCDKEYYDPFDCESCPASKWCEMAKGDHGEKDD